MSVIFVCFCLQNLSVLESHHWRFAMSCIHESHIFDHFSAEQFALVQHFLRSLILATDITQQHLYLQRFRAMLGATNGFGTNVSGPGSATRRSRSPSPPPTPHLERVGPQLRVASTAVAQSLDLRNPEHRLFILQIALKCADLGNPCRMWPLSKQWTQQICTEFYRQGDFERQLNIEVSPIFDRYKVSMAKIQTGQYGLFV